MELALDLQLGDSGPEDMSAHRRSLRALHVQPVDGLTAKGSAMGFDGRRSRIAVLPSPSLINFQCVRVSARIWIEALVGRQTLVEGYLAFSLFVDADGSVAGTVYSGTDWGGVRSSPGVVPVKRWVEIRYSYDGVDTSEIELDGGIQAQEYSRLGPVRDVQWPYGMSVGAWPDADKRLFRGRIDNVRVWKGPA